jgi:GNAT superfamily N-acetyltransferase
VSLEIRSMQPEDAEALAKACAAIDPWKCLGYQAATLQAYLCRDDPALHRYVIGGTDGLLALRRPWLRGAFIEMLAIFPGRQGQGLGRAAVQWAAAQDQSANLWATVSAFNAEARLFYQTVGFVEVAPLRDLVMTGQDEVLLRLRK